MQTTQQLTLAQRLRFEVFNLELNEGLPGSFESQLDIDPFDSFCSHLIVEHLPSKTIVGTYRMQTGFAAQQNLGYYSEREFNLSPFKKLRGEILELGRACIAKEHRNMFVLTLLWQGIAWYARQNGARYLIGCSSINSQTSKDAEASYLAMQRYLSPEEFRIHPQPGFECVTSLSNHQSTFELPKLLSAYLSLGAWICGPPAIDREFKTIDFLTLLDLDGKNSKNRLKRFL